MQKTKQNRVQLKKHRRFQKNCRLRHRTPITVRAIIRTFTYGTEEVSRFVPERFAVVVVVIAASLRYPRRGFLALLGKMSLTNTSLSVSFTMVKSNDCIVRSWFNMGIYSAESRQSVRFKLVVICCATNLL